jgi:hypothetical protein
MEGMALVSLPVPDYSESCRSPRRRSEIHRPMHCRGQGCTFFHGRTKLPFRHAARRRTAGRLLGEGEALYGCLDAGMTPFGTCRRREERQGARPKPGELTIKAGM